MHRNRKLVSQVTSKPTNIDQVSNPIVHYEPIGWREIVHNAIKCEDGKSHLTKNQFSSVSRPVMSHPENVLTPKELSLIVSESYLKYHSS